MGASSSYGADRSLPSEEFDRGRHWHIYRPTEYPEGAWVDPADKEEESLDDDEEIVTGLVFDNQHVLNLIVGRCPRHDLYYVREEGVVGDGEDVEILYRTPCFEQAMLYADTFMTGYSRGFDHGCTYQKRRRSRRP